MHVWTFIATNKTFLLWSTCRTAVNEEFGHPETVFERKKSFFTAQTNMMDVSASVENRGELSGKFVEAVTIPYILSYAHEFWVTSERRRSWMQVDEMSFSGDS